MPGLRMEVALHVLFAGLRCGATQTTRGEGAAGGSEAQTIGKPFPAQPSVQESGVEGIAGAGRIHYLDRKGPDPNPFAAMPRDATLLTKLSHNQSVAVLQLAETFFDVAAPCDPLDLHLVG